MANPEHVAKLKLALEKGDRDIWNDWFNKQLSKHDGFTAQLAGAKLGHADLVGFKFYRADLKNAELFGARLVDAALGSANLSGADLRFADLTRANLNKADLSEALVRNATLREASLPSATLSGAYLEEANLAKSDLRDANLSGAFLFDTLLSRAYLANTDFTGANMGGTLLAELDLSTVRGLETVRHAHGSTLGIDTLYLSGGNIPEVFLRGCGVPETMIAFAKSLVGKAIEYYSCFISYSSADELFARRLHNDLQANGVRVWFAPEDLKIGDKFRTEIDEAIRMYDKLIVVLSRNSIHSDWVEREVEAAFEKERRNKRLVLFPIRLDAEVMETEQAWAADIRRTRHIGDFSKWENPIVYQGVANRLLRDLNASSSAHNFGG